MSDELNYRKKLREVLEIERSLFKPSEATINAIEAELRIRFPLDYRELLSGFGVGSWAGTINMRLPSREYFEIAINMLASEFPEVPFYPEEGGYIPWADSDPRLVICWKVTNSGIRIGSFELGFPSREFSMSFSEFLAAQFGLVESNDIAVFDLSENLYLCGIES